LAVGVGLTLATVAHYFQVLFFPFLVAFWFTFLRPAWDRRLVSLLACMALGWSAIQMPQLYAAYLYTPLTHRADIVVAAGSPFVRFIENVECWPALVLRANNIPLAAAALGLVAVRRRDRRLVASVLFVAAVLGFVYNYHFFTSVFFSHLGVLSSFHFHRLIYLVPFVVAVAAGLGVNSVDSQLRFSLSGNNLIGRRWSQSVPCQLVVATLFATAIAALWLHTVELRHRNSVHGQSFGLLYRHPDVEAIAARQADLPPFRVACVTDAWRPGLMVDKARDWTFAPGYAWAYGLETADGYLVLYARRYKEFWSQVLAPLLSRDEQRFHQHQYWGNMVYLWSPSDGAPDENFAGQYNLDLLSLANVRFIISPYPLRDENLALVPSSRRDRLETLQSLRTPAKFAGLLSGEWPWRPLYVYENRRVLPRFIFVDRVELFDRADDVLTAMRGMCADEFRHTALVCRRDVPSGAPLEQLAGSTSASSRGGDSAADVNVISQSADRIELEVHAPTAGIVTLANSFSPYWKAQVDAAPADVFPVNHTFQGVYVPAGKHRVVLEYKPPYVWWR
jgi:hypothetical protein